LVAGLFREKCTVGWWLISQTNIFFPNITMKHNNLWYYYEETTRKIERHL
jgi:hypothetical protein